MSSLNHYLGSCTYPDTIDLEIASHLGMSFRDLHRAISNSEALNRAAFVKYVHPEDLKLLESILGYCSHKSQGLLMAQDGSVTYHYARTRPERFYFVKRPSAVYIFAKRLIYTNMP